MPVGARTHEEREGHLNQMEESLLDGRSVREVVAAAIKGFGISKSTAYQDIETIKARWETEAPRSRGAEFAKAVNRRERLIARAIAVAKKAEQTDALPTVLSAIGTAASLERDKAKLLNLYPEKMINVRPARQLTPQDMSDEELLAYIGGSGDLSDEELAALAGRDTGEVVTRPQAEVGPHPATHGYGDQTAG